MLDIKDICGMFDNCYDRYESLKFDKLENKLNSDRFLCGLLKLQSLFKSDVTFDISASHDIIYFNTNNDLNVFSQQDVDYLYSCRIRFDSEFDCFCYST